MLKVLTYISAYTAYACTAYTTHRYDGFENVNYRPVVPVNNIFAFGNGNGWRPVQTFTYPKRYDGVVKLSDNVFNSENSHQRADTQYNFQYPFQSSNRQDTWNRKSGTEPPQFYNTFVKFNLDKNHQNVYNTDTNDTRKVVQQNNQEGVVKLVNRTNMLNKSHDHGNITQISIQSDDVNRTLVINKQQITWSNDKSKRNHSSTRDTANITTGNNSNSINNSNISNNNTSKRYPDETYHPTKTHNNRTVNYSEKNKFDVKTSNNTINSSSTHISRPNITRNVNNNTKHGLKTTQDNELTLTAQEGKMGTDLEGDRWIWSNSEDVKVETTTLFDLGDRAAFSGNDCPDGKIKIGNSCIVPD